ncbi:MAG: chorismate mutase [Polyangiaceae bacterium]
MGTPASPPDSQPHATSAIEELRAQIDRLDRVVVSTLAERRRVVAELAGLKRDAGLAAVDSERERALADRWARAAEEEGLPPELAAAVLEVVLRHSRPHVETVLAEGAVCAPTPSE